MHRCSTSGEHTLVEAWATSRPCAHGAQRSFQLCLATYLAALVTTGGLYGNCWLWHPQCWRHSHAGTFDAERLREYMALGVNRFSVGVQASAGAFLYVRVPDACPHGIMLAAGIMANPPTCCVLPTSCFWLKTALA